MERRANSSRWMIPLNFSPRGSSIQDPHTGKKLAYLTKDIVKVHARQINEKLVTTKSVT